MLLVGALLCALGTTPAGAVGPDTEPAPDPARYEKGSYELPAKAPTIPEKAFDLVLLRPLGLAQTAVGAAFFVVFYPISLITGGSDHVVDYAIKSPVHQTFQRPLGAL